MDNLKEISLDDFYDLPVSRIVKHIDSKGFKYDEIEYPNPKQGKTYRNPNVLPTNSRTVNLITIIGVERKDHPDFPRTSPPIIVRLHIEERRVYVKAPEKD